MARRVISLTAGLALCNGIAMARGNVECERETISVLVSPDNAWVALVQEGVCSDGVVVTVSTDTVRLVRHATVGEIQLAPHAEKPDHENDVLVVDYYGHSENRPLIQWLSPRKLQITIPNISGVGLQKSSHEDVEIVLKYEPDDPAARDRWRRERGLAPK